LCREVRAMEHESLLARRLQLADSSRQSEEVRAAAEVLMSESQAALRSEFVKRMNDEIASAMNELHSAMREQSIEDMSSALNDLHLLKTGVEASLQEFRVTLTDVTQQIDSFKQAPNRELDLEIAVEEKMCRMLNEHDKTIAHLREEVQLTVNDLYAAVRAECRENKEELQVAIQETRSNVMVSVQQSNATLTEALVKHASVVEDNHDRIHDRLQSINDKQDEKHALTAEELQLLKSDVGSSLEDMRKTLADVIGQVNNLEQAAGIRDLEAKMESSMRGSFEELELKLRTDLKKTLGGTPTKQAAKLEAAGLVRQRILQLESSGSERREQQDETPGRERLGSSGSEDAVSEVETKREASVCISQGPSNKSPQKHPCLPVPCSPVKEHFDML